MELATARKLIKKLENKAAEKQAAIQLAERYYANQNDILFKKDTRTDKNDNPLRTADNRLSHAWYGLLVDQKASYVAGYPPTFDLGRDDLNDKVKSYLGDNFTRLFRQLVVNASNAGIAWLHPYRDTDDVIRLAVVDAAQIIPIYEPGFKDNKLAGFWWIYDSYDDNADEITVFEFWDDEKCTSFYIEKGETHDLDSNLKTYDIFRLIDLSTRESIGMTNEYAHGFGCVPLFAFRNNPQESIDLDKVKQQIDVYDKVMSGFVNDADDVQEIIFVLTNYGGEDKNEFLTDLKRYKMIQLESDEESKGELTTLAIDIPVEARSKILEITREAIFVLGQGVDPQKNIGTNNSGVALKQMYALLELKVSALEAEFRAGFNELLRFILSQIGAPADTLITQTWTRTLISNDAEMADIVSKLSSVTSRENIAKSNPIVEDPEEELENLAREKQEDYQMADGYRTDEEVEIDEEESSDE